MEIGQSDPIDFKAIDNIMVLPIQRINEILNKKIS